MYRCPQRKSESRWNWRWKNAEQELELEKRNRRQPNPWSSWPKCWPDDPPRRIEAYDISNWRHGTGMWCSKTAALPAAPTAKYVDAQGVTTTVRWLRP